MGRVVSTHPEGRANKVYRFYFDEALLRRLKEVFLMSHMRDLESRLRKDTTDLETQIPFWEFLDIEFDAEKKPSISPPTINKRQLSRSCSRI